MAKKTRRLSFHLRLPAVGRFGRLFAPASNRLVLHYRQAGLLHLFSQWIEKARQVTPPQLAGRLLPPPLAKPVQNALLRRRMARLGPVDMQLLEIARLQGQGRQVVVFPPGLDWRRQLFQRPQHMARALARQGALVFYIQPESTAENPPIEELEERLYLCHVPVQAFLGFVSPLLYTLTWNAKFTEAFHSPRVIYDIVDELEAFQGKRARLLRDHARLIRDAFLVLATSRRLHNQALLSRPDALLCPNGVDYVHFAAARPDWQGEKASIPEDLVPVLEQGRPIAGYYGALAEWFDADLLGGAATLRPGWSFVLIGPEHQKGLDRALLKLPNVTWLGPKPYNMLPQYLRWFDAATIPFKLNTITHATSPLKLFEYMAAGRPVVVTPMEESLRCPGVLPAGSPAEFAEQLDRALQLHRDPAYLALLEQTAQENTWEARASQVLEALSVKQGIIQA